MTEREAMERCIELALQGWGRVAPNPLVGAVLLRDGEVIGAGHHGEIVKVTRVESLDFGVLGKIHTDLFLGAITITGGAYGCAGTTTHAFLAPLFPDGRIELQIQDGGQVVNVHLGLEALGSYTSYCNRRNDSSCNAGPTIARRALCSFIGNS